jgi:hypothetical protein
LKKKQPKSQKHCKPESENSKPSSSLQHFCMTVIFCKEKVAKKFRSKNLDEI